MKYFSGMALGIVVGLPYFEYRNQLKYKDELLTKYNRDLNKKEEQEEEDDDDDIFKPGRYDFKVEGSPEFMEQYKKWKVFNK